MLTGVKNDVKGDVKNDVKQECRKLWLVVSRQEFSAVGALVEQLGLFVDKVRSNKDVEFFGHAKVACATNVVTTNVVYKATVKYEDKTKHYVGMTENSFKTRYTQHKSSIKHSKHRNQTELSSLIWSLTDKGTDYKLTWNIIDRARPYRPGKRTCNLCICFKKIKK